jgi:hypothetical protein
MAALGSVSRVPAPEIEQVIVSVLQKTITERNSGASDRDDPVKFDQDVVATLVTRSSWMVFILPAIP